MSKLVRSLAKTEHTKMTYCILCIDDAESTKIGQNFRKLGREKCKENKAFEFDFNLESDSCMEVRKAVKFQYYSFRNFLC